MLLPQFGVHLGYALSKQLDQFDLQLALGTEPLDQGTGRESHLGGHVGQGPLGGTVRAHDTKRGFEDLVVGRLAGSGHGPS
ncbi:MAG: hypothetical protein WD934_05240 [Gemmatimonadales bacterium]